MKRQTTKKCPTPLAGCLDQTLGLMMNMAALILLFSNPSVSVALPNSFSEKPELLEKLVKPDKLSKREADICYTTGCNRTAAMILKNMDNSVDPCDNFYQYACGKYTENVNSFTRADHNLKQQLRTIFEADIQPDETKAFKLVKKFYKSCMNLSAIEARGPDPLLASIRQMGGWPVLEGDLWNETAFDWKKTIYEFRDNGFPFHYFINIEIGMDPMNSTKRAIFVDAGTLGFPRKVLRLGLSHPYVLAYYKKMVDIATKLGAEKNRAAEDLRKALNFEIDLAKISAGYNFTNIRIGTTVEKLSKDHSYIPWNVYLSRILPSTINIKPNETVYLLDSSYLANLPNLLSRTSKRVQANYLMSSMAMNSIQYVSTVKKQRDKHTSVPHESNEAKSRSAECVGQALVLSFAVDAMYLRRYGNKDIKEDVTAMANAIKSEIAQLLREARWMDEVTRKRAIAKADAIRILVADGGKVLENNSLETIYGKFDMSEDKYYENRLTAALVESNYNMGRLRDPVDKMEHHIPAVIANSGYNAMTNSIELPAGMVLQDIFYSRDRPRYSNYGAVGSIIGYDIARAFNPNVLFDEKNEWNKWWEASSVAEFNNRAQCMIDQYSAYSVQKIGQNVNGTQTRDENIADNMGIKVVYRAYNSWALRNEKEPMLPGINMTANQLFWISAANVWCSPNTVDDFFVTVMLDEHSPPEIRIIGALSNMPEFANDFSCPVGSKMNPAAKCSVW